MGKHAKRQQGIDALITSNAAFFSSGGAGRTAGCEREPGCGRTRMSAAPEQARASRLGVVRRGRGDAPVRAKTRAT